MFLYIVLIYIMTQGLFSHEQNQYFSKHKLSPRSPTMAFSSVRENVTPNTQLELCWKMLLFITFCINLILNLFYSFISSIDFAFIFIFNIISIMFHSILSTDVIVVYFIIFYSTDVIVVCFIGC